MRSGVPGRSARAAALACLVLAACKEGSENDASAGFVPIQPSPDGTQGCAGPNQALVPKVGVFSDPILGPTSQLAAAAGETFYVTGADGSVTELDFSSGTPPVVTTLVAGGVGGPIDQLLASVGIAQPSELSGIAVLDAASLAVVEHTSNTLLLVDRTTPDTVSFLAGFPDAVEGFNDGLAGQARFSFPAGIATGILASSDGRLFVADVGNHAIRMVSVGPPITVTTITGLGIPSFVDGDLTVAGFDSPAGLGVTCGGELLVAELGSFGLGGNRLRSLAIGTPAFFGGFSGAASTLVAGLDAPRGIVTSASGEAYWVDSGTGVLRRYDFGLGTDDCPLFPDCASALATFTPGAAVSLAVSEAGMLYALDGDAGTLYRIAD